MLQHKMEIYGICADCLKERLQEMPLVMAKQGERLIIKDITGGSGGRMRLLTMGLRLGDEIEVKRDYHKQLKHYAELYGKGMVVYWHGFLNNIKLEDIMVASGKPFK